VLSDLIISSEYKFIIRIIQIFYSFHINSCKITLGMLCLYRSLLFYLNIFMKIITCVYLLTEYHAAVLFAFFYMKTKILYNRNILHFLL